MNMPDDTLIRAYATTFLGYGTWTAPFWFVGMEEGGGQSLPELARRVQGWIDEGQPELLDLPRHQKYIGGTDWFSSAAPLQRTWASLIRALQVAQWNDDPTRQSLRDYQQTRLGRADGETALIELLPFPAANTHDWLYGALGIPEYETRKKYLGALRPSRVRRITERINQHQPRAVVFYGNSRYWRRQFLLQTVAKNIHCGRMGKTLLITTTHPTAYGTPNAQWDEIGRMIRDPTTGPQQ